MAVEITQTPQSAVRFRVETGADAVSLDLPKVQIGPVEQAAALPAPATRKRARFTMPEMEPQGPSQYYIGENNPWSPQ